MIKITKNGYLHFKNKCVTNNTVLMYLAEKVSLEEGFTLNSFFKMFNLYPNLCKIELCANLYVDFYNSTVDANKSDILDTSKTIIFNTYMLDDEKNIFDKNHNLAVKLRSGHISNINNYQLFEIMNHPIIINEHISTLKVEQNPNYDPKAINPVAKRLYVKQPDVHNVKYPAELFYFIMFVCGSLFRGMTPEQRRNTVELTDLSYGIMADDIMKEIGKRVSSNRQ